MSETSESQWVEWLEQIEQDGVNLTTWEEEFVESIRDQVDAGRPLSRKQGDIIESIYSKRVPD